MKKGTHSSLKKKNLMSIEFGVKTDVGLLRNKNEDDFIVNVDDGFFVVADGMGGHLGGDIASFLTCRLIKEGLIKELSGNNARDIIFRIHRVLNWINQEIRRVSTKEPNMEGMGSTITLLLLREERYYIAQIGDSRVYLLRGEGLLKLTQDHSQVQELIDKGMITEKEAKYHSQAHIITRCIGVEDSIKPDFYYGDVTEGDIFLLCTDGLWGLVEKNNIEKILKKKKSPQQLSEILVEKAKSKGGNDNITALVIKVKGLGKGDKA
jgi:serine/threonine protein phosphatase PrpC